MAQIELDLSDDMIRWLEEQAAEYGFTTGQMLEHLVILESGLRDVDPLGRGIHFRDTVYRQLTPRGWNIQD